MTDIMSEDYGRAIVERTSYENEAVWLPLLAVHHLNAGQGIIKGKTFTNCVIEGPGLIVPVRGVAFDGCNLGAVKDPSSLFYEPKGPMLAGAVGFEDCRFINCRFSQVGFTGNPDFISTMLAQMTAAREAA